MAILPLRLLSSCSATTGDDIGASSSFRRMGNRSLWDGTGVFVRRYGFTEAARYPLLNEAPL